MINDIYISIVLNLLYFYMQLNTPAHVIPNFIQKYNLICYNAFQ